MAKKNRLVSKKTKKKMKRALPWAIAALSTAGMFAAALDRGLRSKVKTLTAGTIEKIESVRPHHKHSNGMVNGIVPQESGAV